ncbi:MAG: flagellar basal body protein, partial [Caulobacteraceae bacterium]
MTFTIEAADPGQHVDHLTALTERLTERLLLEIQAFKAQRPQDTQITAAETIRLANIYRQES